MRVAHIHGFTNSTVLDRYVNCHIIKYIGQKPLTHCIYLGKMSE